VTEKSRLAQTSAYFSAFVAVGLCMAALGPTLPGLARQAHVTDRGISYLFTLRLFGLLVGSLLSAPLYDRLPGHPVMGAMIVVMSAANLAIPFAPNLATLMAAMLVLGATEGGIDVGGNTLLIWIHGKRVPPYMNALHFFYGAGTLISPLIVAKALQVKGDTRFAYFVIAMLVLPAGALLVARRSPIRPSQNRGESTGSVVKVDVQPMGGTLTVITLLSLLLCFYVGAEISFGGWIYTYVVRTKLGDESLAAYITSIFWASFTIGRLTGIGLAARLRPRMILLMDLIGCFAALGLALASPYRASAITIASAGIGLSMASFYPTAMTFAAHRVKITGRVTSVLVVGGSIGGMIIPLVIGQLFDSMGPRILLVTVLAALALALIVYLVVAPHSLPIEAGCGNEVRRAAK